jgi:hypothetical protein
MGAKKMEIAGSEEGFDSSSDSPIIFKNEVKYPEIEYKKLLKTIDPIKKILIVVYPIKKFSMIVYPIKTANNITHFEIKGGC